MLLNLLCTVRIDTSGLILKHHWPLYFSLPSRNIPQDSAGFRLPLTSHAVTFMHAPTLITNTNAPYPES
jgi:hypothetical protein